MVRKQLYIEERHERALKRRAKALGVSEADVVRRALDAALGDEERAVAAPDQRDALGELLERAAQFAAGAEGGPKAARYRREGLYEEREGRWARAR